MKKLLNILLYIAIVIWTLPQTFIGLFVLLFCKLFYRGTEVTVYRGVIHVSWPQYSGVSLGLFIFTHKRATKDTYNHEWGHTRQSLILGPLYLIVIGLPSIIWAGCFSKYRKIYDISYYSFYPEKWADKAGGVDRK